MTKKTTVLMILDGYGLSEETQGNAIRLAKTPVMDHLMETYPFVEGKASGLAVGLPEGQMGNSEVGHLNIGAGRVVYQDLTRITKSIADGDFFENPALQAAVTHCKEHDSALHLYGLLSDGGVHSHNSHLYALLQLAKREDLQKVFVHCFLDGRDTPPDSAVHYVTELEEKMQEIGVGQIASVIGRYYAMDRDQRWDRVEKAYDCLTGSGAEKAHSAIAYLQDSYAKGVTDEFVVPANVVGQDGTSVAVISDHDSVIFFDFRPDRAREITRAFCQEDFTGFARKKTPQDLCYVCFTQYDVTIPHTLIAFGPETLTNTLGEYLSKLGLTQLRTAETEKYAHVTFFFNGGVEAPNPGEERILVPSPKVATYDMQPQMSAPAVTDVVVQALQEKKYDVIIVNYANSDMVGHTGVLPAAIQAVETVDDCVGRVLDALLDVDGQMFICADHGNSDKMVDETGKPFTAHTTNPVPFILVNGPEGCSLKEGGKLADIAPTLLDMMGLEKPEEMTGESLLVRAEDK